jgi:hypothetical protein
MIPPEWPDDLDDVAGDLDISEFAMSLGFGGAIDMTFTFDEPFDPTYVGGDDWVSVILDVDGGIGTGWPFSEYEGSQPVLGYDFLVDFIYTEGTWTAQIVRTPAEAVGEWGLVEEVPAFQGVDENGASFVTASIPLAFINDPAYFNFIAFTEFLTEAGEIEADYVPDFPGVILSSGSYPDQPPFPDIGHGWVYEKAVADLAHRGIILGYNNGEFGPQDPVTRQQFAKLIVLTLGIPTSEANVSPFRDVAVSGPGTLYPDNYVAVCASEGITLGTGKGLFSPWNNISRAQVLTMVARAADLPEPPGDYQPPFGEFSPDHYSWARKAAYFGLMNSLTGVSPYYDFWQPATRGETAAILYNLLHRLPTG